MVKRSMQHTTESAFHFQHVQVSGENAETLTQQNLNRVNKET